MRTLLVQAHPRDDSLSRAIFEVARAALAPPEKDSSEQKTSVLRLYHGDTLTAAALSEATELVVVAPTWWGAMPAILLDALQQSLGPWVDGSGPKATVPVSKITRLIVITTHGSPLVINRLQGEPGKQLWQRTVLPLCSPNAVFSWIALYGIDRLSRDEIGAFLDRVADELSRPAITNRSASD